MKRVGTGEGDNRPAYIYNTTILSGVQKDSVVVMDNPLYINFLGNVEVTAEPENVVDVLVNSNPGPQGETGPQGDTGLTGPRGPRGYRGYRGYTGDKGEKGNPGNFLGINLIGSSTDIANRPVSATDGDAWGLIENGEIRIYVWLSASSSWFDAGLISSLADTAVVNTLYVAENGNDADAGTSKNSPLASIEKAVTLASEKESGGVILVGPGVYVSQGHIDVPDNWGVICYHRSAEITAAEGFEQRNVFRVGSGSYVEGFTGTGFQIDNLENPREGFLIAFRPGAVIRRVPYAHKVVAYRAQPPELVSAGLDRNNGNPNVGNGMGVVIADGSQISPFSAFPNIMTWGATPANPNGIGYVARNRALINAVNAVSLWCHKHHLAIGGGQIILSSCSTQFGDWSLWSEGFAEILRIPKVATYSPDASVAPAIEAASDTIINEMWTALVGGGYTTGWTIEDEQFTRRDAAIFLKTIGYALEEGKQRAVEEFARGMFGPVEDGFDPTICRLETVFSSDKLAAFQFAFEDMRNSINGLVGVNAAAQTAVTNLVAMLNGVLATPQKRKSRSLITAIGHTWTLPMAGVTRSGVPPVFGGSGRSSQIERSVRQRKGGVVRFSGQDEEGNAVFVGGLKIDARTGQLGGRPFDSAVELRAVEAAISTGGV